MRLRALSFDDTRSDIGMSEVQRRELPIFAASPPSFVPMKIFLVLIAAYCLAFAGAFAAQGPTVGLQPRTFTLNKGQWPAHVVAATRYGDVDMFITRDGMVVDRYHSENGAQARSGAVVHIVFHNSQPGTLAVAPYIGSTTFIHGRDASRWVTAPTVESVTLKDVYEGIDVVYHYDGASVRFDLHVAAFASTADVALRVVGEMPRVESNGVVTLGNAGVSVGGLVVLQQGQILESAMSVSQGASNALIEFDILDRNIAQPMVIDPVVYGTYLGTGLDTYAGIKRLVNGDIAVAGTTTALRFPGTVGGYKDSLSGGSEVFVAVFDSTLSRVKSYTYVGGKRDDVARNIATDERGGIYVAGTTTSDDFPTSASSAGPVYRGERDAFVVKLVDDARRLAIGVYVGGSADDIANAIAVDADSNVYVAGETRSVGGFPLIAGYQRTHGGRLDGFVTKISSNGSRFIFSTYLGSSGDESFYGLDVDANGSVLVAGYTSADTWKPFPPVPFNPGDPNPPYQPRYGGGRTDATVARFNPDGGSLLFAGFLGGSGDDVGRAAFFDGQGRPNITITTTSSNLEIVGGFAQNLLGGVDLAQYTFSFDGRILLASTFFGGTGDDEALSVVPDVMGGVLVGGVTSSMDFPRRGPGSSIERNGPTDGFVTSLSTGLIRASDLIAGNGDDAVVAVSSDPYGDAYFVATVASDVHRTHGTAYDKEFRGPRMGYVGKLVRGTLALSSPIGGEQWCLGSTQTVSWSEDGMLPTDRYTVEVSPDSGFSWTSISSNVRASNFVWPLRELEPGSYMLRVRSERGHLVQTPLPLMIIAQPAIVQQPTAVADCAGRPATLTVVAAGTNNTYRWRLNGVAIDGATSSTHNITGLTPAVVGRYDCVVSGRCNPAVTTIAVDVSIVEAPVLTAQPRSQSIDKGQRLTLEVAALGSDLLYQWLKDGTSIADATQSSFEIAVVDTKDAGTYVCRVTSACGTTLSEPAAVVVLDPTSVTSDWVLHGIHVRGPSPAAEYLTLELNADIGDVSIELVALTGAVISRDVSSATLYRLDVSAVPVGLYLLQVGAGQRLYRSSIVIAR